jgi:hypothetical protein
VTMNTECRMLIILTYCTNSEYFAFLLPMSHSTVMYVWNVCMYVCMHAFVCTYVTMKTVSVQDVMLCGIGEMCQYFTMKHCLHLQGRRGHQTQKHIAPSIVNIHKNSLILSKHE